MVDGAGDGTRTREYKLGKLVPYHLATPASVVDQEFLHPDCFGIIAQNELIRKG